MYYKSKSSIVEAYHFIGRTKLNIIPLPAWIIYLFETGKLFFENDTLFIKIRRGNVEVKVGDYIIYDNNELNVMHKELFLKSYEKL